MIPITGETSVAEVIARCPGARRIFDEHGLRGCGGEHGPRESLAFFASVHQADLNELLRALSEEQQHPSPAGYLYRESLQDFIYRRFFKAGIAVVLTLGALWGAVNLLQIALGGTFLQIKLLASIHAHAHAMIYGWVGLFVMGFAYQSFPRFKNTTLWKPRLANLTLYLMLAGIVARVAAELLAPAPVAFALGAFSAVVEVTAIALFISILYHTARKSLEPHNRYEKFIFGAMFWFAAQALLSPFFFFAKATAVGQDQLVMRIATIDGPLRDIQLLGFAALIIAGVSQRFVPLVYGLKLPARDRLKTIFALVNFSLLLDVVCYVLLLRTRNLWFAAGLELSYLLMPVWAVLLALQLNVFSAPTQPDRSFKFIRAAYIWLLIAMGMLPFFPLYGLWTHQVFAHSFMGSHRHAFTVGFVSMMILGVSSRVVPILAGVASDRLDSLWWPFLLLNAGCAGRVVLQILTDWAPGVAYPLIGFTGFIEVTALAWWGIGLWRVMNRVHVRQPQAMSTPLVAITR